MKSQEVIHIAIAEASLIIRIGLALKRLPELNIQTVEITSRGKDPDALHGGTST